MYTCSFGSNPVMPGVKNFAFQDVEKNQQASVYKDWFSIVSRRDSVAGKYVKFVTLISNCVTLPHQ